jgi:hypothetical protein
MAGCGSERAAVGHTPTAIIVRIPEPALVTRGSGGCRDDAHHEAASLRAAGRADLARRVRWISEEEGDGAGYDIASFRPDGQTRLIEVKTTNG